MSSAALEDRSPFAGGPAELLENRVGLVRGGEPQLALGALLAVGVAWLSQSTKTRISAPTVTD
jgi:hypothetical protein